MPWEISNSRNALSAMAFSTATSRWISSTPSPERSAATRTLRAILVDLVLQHLLGLAEVGRDVEMELVRQGRHLGLGTAHLELGVVRGDLVLHIVKLLDRALNFQKVILVCLFMKSRAAFRFRPDRPWPA